MWVKVKILATRKTFIHSCNMLSFKTSWAYWLMTKRCVKVSLLYVSLILDARWRLTSFIKLVDIFCLKIWSFKFLGFWLMTRRCFENWSNNFTSLKRLGPNDYLYHRFTGLMEKKLFKRKVYEGQLTFSICSGELKSQLMSELLWDLHIC